MTETAGIESSVLPLCHAELLCAITIEPMMEMDRI